jgi:hypothetical protein
METLKDIHKTINKISEDPQVNITQKDEYTFDIIIHGKLSESFFKLGDIQKEINELCSDEYTLKTIFGEGQDATFILEKNS